MSAIKDCGNRAATAVLLLGVSIAGTWLIEGFVLGIVAYLHALLVAVLSIRSPRRTSTASIYRGSTEMNGHQCQGGFHRSNSSKGERP